MKPTAQNLLDQLKDRIRIQLEEAIRLLTKYKALTPYEYTNHATGERATEMVACGYSMVFKMGSLHDGEPEPLYFNRNKWERATNADDAYALARSADLLLERARDINPRRRH